VILVTRSDLADSARAIEHTLRRWNPHAPVFCSRLEPVAWVDYRTGATHPPSQPPFERAVAFCGLGNPRAFYATLAHLPIEPVECVDYSDHHRYRPHELERLAHRAQARGAGALVTTEKDLMNLCDGAAEIVAPLPLFWLKVRTVIEREGDFVDLVEKRLK
jgi:tetraacyldisaccharide-1-P 4'-kinase